MIAPLAIEDVAEVARLDSDLFGSIAWSEQAWLAEVTQADDARRYVVMRKSGTELMGYAGVLRAGSDADVLNVAVSPRWRRQGHGTALVRALLDIAREWRCLAIFLEVDQDNEAARELYGALGFREIGTRRHYYGAGRHAVTMRLQLREPLGSAPMGDGL